MGCKDAVLPESFFKKIIHSIALLTNRTPKKAYKGNLCFFRVLALYLHGNERLEGETSKLFNLFHNNSISFVLTIQSLTLQTSKEFA